ncbi:histone H4 [Coccidioides immitis RS]|uniref:Histone H4 n=2 Tax=Coccidioides immitis TaxID=5501 RepID=J3K1T4_COCIM|nr:histone H4 [Coccidioides immitis RS]EAS27983.3 histone H4 [Coccidioides immitis RS]KMP08791.1 hypothetical protein CIRG_08472 [Coccidioides immitis RMSCC 2394]
MTIPYSTRPLSSKGMEHLTHLRYRKQSRDNIIGITRPAIRRLARRGGVKRIQKSIYDTAREVLLDRLRMIIRQIVEVLESGGSSSKTRKTVTTEDVVYVLQRIGSRIYGFGTTLKLK